MATKEQIRTTVRAYFGKHWPNFQLKWSLREDCLLNTDLIVDIGTMWCQAEGGAFRNSDLLADMLASESFVNSAFRNSDLLADMMASESFVNTPPQRYRKAC